MPFTFLSHQGVVLPLKQGAPRWFDGTALVIGSAVPDLVNALSDTPWEVHAHAFTTQLWLSWPLTVVAAVVVKRLVAPLVAPLLPDLPPFHLRDYAALGRWPADRSPARAGIVLAASALLGPLTHIALDAFTHSDGWVVERSDALRATLVGPPDALAPRAVHVYDALQILVSVLTAAIAVASLAAMGRRRLVRATYGPPPAAPVGGATRRLLVAATVAGALVGLILTVVLRDRGTFSALVLRPVDVAAVALVAACGAARFLPGAPPHDDRGGDGGTGADEEEDAGAGIPEP